MPFWDGRIKKWIGRVRTAGMPTQTRAFDRKADAKAWEVDTKRSPTQQPKTDMVFSDAYSEYLDYAIAQFTQATYREKRNIGRQFIQFVGDRPLDEIKPKDIHDFLLHVHQRSSANRANVYRKNLLAFWRWAGRLLDIQTNPVEKVRKFSHHRKAQYIPPESHILSILAACNRTEKVFLEAYLHTAARRSAVFQWKWTEDVDFNLKQVRVGSAKTRDGSREYYWLPMSAELEAGLKWWYRNRPHRESEYVFTVPYGIHSGEGMKSAQEFIPRLCRRAGVPRFSFHALRRYAATRLAASGVSMVLIQRILGHKQLATTERYLGRSNEDLRATMEVLSHSQSSIYSANHSAILSSGNAKNGRNE